MTTESSDLFERLRQSARGSVLANLAVPAAIVVVVVAYLGWGALQRQREAREAAAAELAAADRARAEQIRGEAEERRMWDDRLRAGRRDARIAQALKDLSSRSPLVRCDATQRLGRSGDREHVPTLAALLSPSTEESLRICAASALVDLGETDIALAAFVEWVNGDDPDLRRSGLMGFGEIGPAAASVALPYLTEELKSTEMSARYLAVNSLAKLGPSAVPLLELAAADPDKHVRARAAEALRTIKAGNS